jgi:hypothetical protein
MNNRVKSHLQEQELVGLTGCPTQIDEYVEWFNQRFTFAKARVLRDARGIKFLDIEYGK